MLMMRNLATNPSMERVQPGATPFRRNLILNPRLANNNTGWGASTAAGLARIEAPDSGYRWAQSLTHQSGFSSGSRLHYRMDNLVVGRQYAVSGAWWITPTVSSSTYWRFSVSTDSNNGGQTVISRNLHGNGQWQRDGGTFVASATTMWVQIRRVGAGTIPEEVRLTGLLLEEAQPSAALPYFDGTTVDDTGFAYAWEGTAHASVSAMRSTVSEQFRNLSRFPRSGNRVLNRGSGATATGSYTSEGGIDFFRATRPADDTVNTWRFVSVNAPAPADGATSGSGAIVAGQTYTLLVRLRTSVATPSIGIGIRDSSATNTCITFQAPAIPANQWTWVRATAVASSNGFPNNVLYLDYLSRQPVGTGFFDVAEVLVTPGVYAGEYFDGNASSDIDLVPSWTGAENASPSILSAPVPADVVLGGYLSSKWAQRGQRSLYVPDLPELGLGPTAGDLVAPATNTVASQTLTIDPKASVTMASVSYHAGGMTNDWTGWATLGGGTAERHAHRTGGTGSTALRAFTDLKPDGTLNSDLQVLSSRKGVFALISTVGTANRTLLGDEGGSATGTVTRATMGGWSPLALYAARTTDMFAARALLWDRELTSTEQIKLMSWLRLGYKALTITNQTFVITPRVTGQVVRLNGMDVAGVAGKPIYVQGTGQIGLGPGFWDSMMIIDGVYNAPYFDGDTVGGSWEGARLGSASRKQLPAISFWDATKQEERWLKVGHLGPLALPGDPGIFSVARSTEIPGDPGIFMPRGMRPAPGDEGVFLIGE